MISKKTLESAFARKNGLFSSPFIFQILLVSFKKDVCSKELEKDAHRYFAGQFQNKRLRSFFEKCVRHLLSAFLAKKR